MNCGTSVSQSDYEAKRWHNKAAKQGHPVALYNLSLFYLRGRCGCSVDLSKARQLTENSMLLDPRDCGDACRKRLIDIAGACNVNEAKSILIPLAEGGMAAAQYRLGCVVWEEKDILNAKHWFESAALQGDIHAAYWALDCCDRLQTIRRRPISGSKSFPNPT